MARLVCFGSVRSPTWLRTGPFASNTDTTTKIKHTHHALPPPLMRGRRGGLAVKTPTPSPITPASTGTLAATTPTSSSSSSSSSSRTLTGLGIPGTTPKTPAVVVQSARGEEVDCHRVSRHGVEFRLVQRRSGLVAMRRSRKARHRREREGLAGVFKMVEEDKGRGKRRDKDASEGEGVEEEDRPVYWELLEKLDRERQNSE
ncbi:hypothetical protein VM1G_03199 [Cytospora mali]|uniref:Uncharacterized protein n=1 Tax=Cytospora mali TaxID=578113 RepID=A0A194VTM5_CYTMA|nr:hypothetical protein VM1G_03199 [Valsa mali]